MREIGGDNISEREVRETEKNRQRETGRDRESRTQMGRER